MAIAGGGFNSYAAGNKVYNGGSPQPTSGTVDPTGYINRELNKSQSRSGLAAAALANMSGIDPNTGQVSNAVLSNPQIAPPSQIGVPITQTPSLPSIPAAMPTQKTTNTQVPILNPVVPTLNINDLGQITLPASSTLPLDADFVAQMAAGTQAAQQQLANLTQQQQQISQQYATNTRSAVDTEPQLLNKLLNAYAGNGLAHSSGYGQAVENANDQLMQTLNNLFTSAQNGLNSISSQSALVPNTLNQLISQLQSSQSTRNIQNAGTLSLNNQLAQLLNPQTQQQSIVVNNPIDLQEALLAGYNPNQIYAAQGSSVPGLGTLPSTAQNVIYAGKAGGSNTPSGGINAGGIDRNDTERILAALRNS